MHAITTQTARHPIPLLFTALFSLVNMYSSWLKNLTSYLCVERLGKGDVPPTSTVQLTNRDKLMVCKIYMCEIYCGNKLNQEKVLCLSELVKFVLS